jgi:hypothetical protein
VALAATLGGLWLFLFASNGGTEKHLDGDGILGSTGDPSATNTYAFSATVGGPRRSVGIPLCLTQGNSAAVLDGYVEPMKTVGHGYVFLGALVRGFRPTQSDPMIATADAFPPAVPDRLLPLRGFAVTRPCPQNGGASSAVEAQLILGFGRGTGDEGGGWQGVELGYTANGHHYVVVISYNIFMCGTTVPHDDCQG